MSKGGKFPGEERAIRKELETAGVPATVITALEENGQLLGWELRKLSLFDLVDLCGWTIAFKLKTLYPTEISCSIALSSTI